MKQAKKPQGFTLIELMIVIVILGVLMVTVVPKLVGSQARARDTGRTASLANISAALQTYYDDTGNYPGTANTVECLNPTTPGTVSALLAPYLKGAVVPSDTAKTNAIGATPTCSEGMFYYKPISKSAVARNAYSLCANVETWQKGNATFATVNAATTFAAAAAAIGDLTAENATNANESVYCLIGE